MTSGNASNEEVGRFEIKSQAPERLHGIITKDRRAKDLILKPDKSHSIHVASMNHLATQINRNNTHKGQVVLHVTQPINRPWKATLESINGTDVIAHAKEHLTHLITIEMQSA